MGADTRGRQLGDHREIVERVHNLIAICHGRQISYLNSAGCQLLGLNNALEARGRNLTDFFHSDYRDIADLGLEVFADESELIALKLVRTDGITVDVEMWVHPYTPETAFEDGQPWFMIEAHDITAHMRSARALRSREQRLEGIINTVADGIITLDDRGLVQSFNPAAEAIFGFSREEIIGRSIKSLIPISDDNCELGQDWAQVLKPRGEAMGLRKDGGQFPLELAIRELQQGEQLTFTSIVRDITARKEAEQKVHKLAHTDGLTGLPNRHLFADRLEHALDRARRQNTTLALLFIDLDHFKPINDTLGHAAGDRALMTVARHLSESIRASDTAARLGGDEFVVLLEDLNIPEEAMTVARKIIAAITGPMRIADHDCVLGASIGVAVYPDSGADLKSLMNAADHAMYDAKRGGRGQVRLCAEVKTEPAPDRATET